MSSRSGTPAGADDVRVRAAGVRDLAGLDEAIIECRACPRLVAWREQVAREKRAAYADQTYWGRPAPGFGDPDSTVLVLGLAPAAHGANRTGRVFTGDRSGDWLFGALHRAGVADRPTSQHLDDGLTLTGVRIAAAVRCAPPANAPTSAERDTCAPWLDREIALLPQLRSVLALGGFAWSAALAALDRAAYVIPRPRPSFGHAAVATLPGHDRRMTLVGCYHPSQQNTFTGRLTESMLDDAIAIALREAVA